MNSNEAKIQLNSLIEHFKHGGLDFNATDISAIEILLEENRKYKEVINKAIKHVSSLSSRGRDCMIYADVKKDILDILKEVEHD